MMLEVYDRDKTGELLNEARAIAAGLKSRWARSQCK